MGKRSRFKCFVCVVFPRKYKINNVCCYSDAINIITAIDERDIYIEIESILYAFFFLVVYSFNLIHNTMQNAKQFHHHHHRLHRHPPITGINSVEQRVPTDSAVYIIILRIARGRNIFRCSHISTANDGYFFGSLFSLLFTFYVRTETEKLGYALPLICIRNGTLRPSAFRCSQRSARIKLWRKRKVKYLLFFRLLLLLRLHLVSIPLFGCCLVFVRYFRVSVVFANSLHCLSLKE